MKHIRLTSLLKSHILYRNHTAYKCVLNVALFAATAAAVEGSEQTAQLTSPTGRAGVTGTVSTGAGASLLNNSPLWKSVGYRGYSVLAPTEDLRACGGRIIWKVYYHMKYLCWHMHRLKVSPLVCTPTISWAEKKLESSLELFSKSLGTLRRT